MNVLLPGPLDRDEALALARKRLSHADVRVLESTPEGAALLRMLADIAADQSARADRSITARHLLARESDVNPIASGAAFARVELSFVRRRLGFRLVLPAGTRVETVLGHAFALDADVVFAAANGGPLLATGTALVAGYGSSVLAGSIRRFARATSRAAGDEASVTLGPSTVLETTGGDHFVSPMRGLYVEFTDGANKGRCARIVDVLGPAAVALDDAALVAEVRTASWVLREWSELGVFVSQPTDATLAPDDALDELGREVDRRRQPGESDDDLRIALLTLQDTVSIGAIIRACNRVLGPYGPVVAFETGTPASEAEPKIGLDPCPGIVAGLTPCGVAPDALDAPSAPSPASPPAGLTAAMPLYRFFVLRWQGAGLGDPGAYARDSTTGVLDDEVPMAAAAGISPAGGFATGDAALRAAISATVQQIKAGGVGFRWYPRRFFDP